MALEGGAGPAPVDLERELTCSICTDLLYQPLTLLDCLHTFCGACLKEWFAFQASTATSRHPYTCPSCRSAVRSTQPNATVTTLLDMFIQANPHRGKSEDEKKADREKFKYGDNVLPRLRKRGGDDGGEEERRMLEEVQQLSLREVGIDTSGSSALLEPPRERRRRERSRDRTSRSRSQETRRSADTARSRSRNAPAAAAPRDVGPPRVVEHQSSLRSLLSASELDSQEMEEEIMRQIMEDGLLDGIDLTNIDVTQEDEISERIAAAYRRRQNQRQQEQRDRRERLAREGVIASGPSTPQGTSDAEQARRRAHRQAESGSSTPRDRSHRPPVSRPALLDVANSGATRHHRSSSQGSSRSARSERRPPPLTVSSARAGELPQREEMTRPGSSSTAPVPRRRQSDNQQHATVEERRQFRSSLQSHTASNPTSPRRSAFNISTTTESPTSTTAPAGPPSASVFPSSMSMALAQPVTSRRTTDPTGIRQVVSARPRSPTHPVASFPRTTSDPSTPDRQQSTNSTTEALTSFPEPNLTCRACGKAHVEYDVHYNCAQCDEGTFNLCQPCYRRGTGCKHWFGFGWAAYQAYQRRAPPEGFPAGKEKPHIMRGQRYKRPANGTQQDGNERSALLTTEDPTRRLESGVFCDICSQWANACYWKCDYCNEGEWGFCNDCVNQGRHCSHALLPITHVGKDEHDSAESPRNSADPLATPPRPAHLAPHSSDGSPPSTPPLTPRSASLVRGPGVITLVNTTFRPLTFTTICDICTYPIPPSHTRYHCLQCNEGHYDLCTSCYKKLVTSRKIGADDGPNGWRRCLRGHRMIVAGFEDRDGGQRRVVVRDLVGGLALREEEVPPSAATASPPAERSTKWTWQDTDGARQQQHLAHHSHVPHDPATENATTTAPAPPPRFPPDGGVGLRVQARWSYFPGEDALDELGFPKLAEISEAEDINGDWFWGVYAGKRGLFPGNYGVVVGGR